jgi:hypothetical protein
MRHLLIPIARGKCQLWACLAISACGCEPADGRYPFRDLCKSPAAAVTAEVVSTSTNRRSQAAATAGGHTIAEIFSRIELAQGCDEPSPPGVPRCKPPTRRQLGFVV